MTFTEETAALLQQLADLAGPEDVAEVRDAALREATRLRHQHVVPGHVLMILVRNAADPDLLAELGVSAATTPAQLLDRAKSEVDSAAIGRPLATQSSETIVVARAPEAGATCPECGEALKDNTRYETRRVPSPEGGRGSVMTRVALCGSCGNLLGTG